MADEQTSRSPLELDGESMRRLGYQVIDRLVERAAAMREGPAWQPGDRTELEQLVGGPPDELPGDAAALVDHLLTAIVPHGQRPDHPRFLGYVPGAATWPAVMGDLLATGCNIFAGSWIGSSGATAVELEVLAWFCSWLGYPASAEGILTSGGSEANLLGVLCARNAVLADDATGGVVYLSSETHSSVDRALRAAGFAADAIRHLPVDHARALDVPALAAAISADRAAGRHPALVIANAGTTGTGAIDPLAAVAAVCRRDGVWMHVDAAYGGCFALTSRGRDALRGLGEADSITLDPHKGLAQPWGTGCLLVQRPGLLASAFHLMPAYLRDSAVHGGEVNMYDRGLQLTRPARALKIWLSVHALGLAAFRASLDNALDLAQVAEATIREHPAAEIVAPASLGIVCFRRSDGRNDEAVRALNATGVGHVSSTALDGEVVLRICANNFTTTEADVAIVLDRLLGPLPARRFPARRR